MTVNCYVVHLSICTELIHYIINRERDSCWPEVGTVQLYICFLSKCETVLEH